MTTHAVARPAGTAQDDTFTVCAIAVLAAMIASVLHEGVGHAAIALLTGTQSGVLTAVAWSSEYDSRLVAAGGTLVNLAAASFFWIVLRRAKNASVELRYLLVLSMAFNLFDGTGYFFFSGVTDFGDWATVIQPMQPHWAWRTALAVTGIASYFGAVVLVGRAYVRVLGIPLNDGPRLRKLSLLPYISAIAIVCLAGWFNPIGKQLMWQSALPATAGGHSGLLWFRYYIPKARACRSSRRSCAC
ncbi:MAG TPA: hypothetical protein VLL05_18725, partial [Terriglobales bacterium]|nr:hypothetical protein [Terriglobales bacterium]